VRINSAFAMRLCRNPCKSLAVMLSKAKHLAFSSGYEVEILRLSPQNDIETQSQKGDLRAISAADIV